MMDQHPLSFLLVSLVISVAFLPVGQTESAVLGPGQPHSQIAIRSESDLLLPSIVNGVVSGSGSPDDPFVIAGWNIVPATDAGIRIENTKSHIVVRNVFIHDGDNIPNMCVLDDSFCGPHRWLSCSLPVVGCSTVPPLPAGIAISNSANVSIERVIVAGINFGVHIENSVDVSVSDSVIARRWQGSVGSSLINESAVLLEDLEGLQKSSGIHGLEFMFMESRGVFADSVEGLDLVGNRIVGFEYLDYGLSRGVVLRGVEGTLSGNMIGPTATAIAADATVVLIEANRIVDSRLGADIGEDVRADIRGNEFKSALSSALIVCGRDTQAIFELNRFENTVVRTGCTNPVAGFDVVIARNDFVSEAGVWMNAAGSIKANVFKEGGLWLPDGSRLALSLGWPVEVDGNTFTESDVAMATWGVSADVTNNRFIGNGIGLAAMGEQKPTLRHNSFSENAEYALFSLDEGGFDRDGAPGLIVADARLNWWGSETGPAEEGPNSIYGAADVEPWLASPPGS